jgi:uncharacterized protein (TIGR00725 family)
VTGVTRGDTVPAVNGEANRGANGEANGQVSGEVSGEAGQVSSDATGRALHIACIGGYDADGATLALAELVGEGLAQRGAVVVTGGRRGVAEAASKGARRAGGLTIGILPGRTRDDANPFVQVAVPTGLGETRNALVVMDADAVIAFPGVWGTLSELAFALLAGTPVVTVGDGTWDLPGAGVVKATSPADAVDLAMSLAISLANGRRPPSTE